MLAFEPPSIEPLSHRNSYAVTPAQHSTAQHGTFYPVIFHGQGKRTHAEHSSNEDAGPRWRVSSRGTITRWLVCAAWTIPSCPILMSRIGIGFNFGTCASIARYIFSSPLDFFLFSLSLDPSSTFLQVVFFPVLTVTVPGHAGPRHRQH
jgi:hypothetical protein